jgi:hypothetical protein
MILLGVVRNEMSAAADELIATGDRWQRSYQAWQRAVEHRDRVIARTERRVAHAEVQAVVEEAQRLQAVEEAAVLATRLELAEATKQVLGYGRLGQQLTGMTSAELHRLARRPRNAPAVPAE